MDLFEFEGKRLLREYGVSVPRGVVWGESSDYPLPAVVKAQILAGGRGKAGGIVFAEAEAELHDRARGLLGRCIAGHIVEHIYVEQRVATRNEYYLSLAVDRDRGAATLLASPEGGVEVEDRSARIRPLALTIDPLLGPRDYHARALTVCFGLEDPAALGRVRSLLAQLWRAFVNEDATLIEINPLAVNADSDFVALDAKISIDDNSLFRHTHDVSARPGGLRGSELENALAALGVSYTVLDPDGDLVAAVSGAGLMMATLDMARDAGVSVRGTIDLGGTVLAADSRTRQVFEAIFRSRPRQVFVNGFLHTASCARLCEALQLAATEWDRARTEVVVRIKGQDSESGRYSLRQLGMVTYAELDAALAHVTGKTRATEVADGHSR